MRQSLALYCLALSGAGISGVSAGVIPPSLAAATPTPAAEASLSQPGQTLSLPRPTNVLIHARQDNSNNNAQIQQLQQQNQQDQQRNDASLSSVSSSFSSRLTSLSSSASSTLSQLQTSLQSAQQAVNTLQQSANDASRSASDASRSAASAVASVQSSAASAQSALSSSLQASMVASAASAEQFMSVSMSSVMVAAVASVSAAVVAEQAQAIANLPPPQPTATGAGISSDVGVPDANGAAAQSQQSLVQTGKQNDVLGACTTPEVVLAFAGIVLGAVGLASLGCIVFLWYWKKRPATAAAAKSQKKQGGSGSSGISGESRSSGGSLRQWRIRASTAMRPNTGSNKTAVSPKDASPKEYKLPEYERVFSETKENKAASGMTSSKSTVSPAKGTTTAATSATATATAVTTDDRIFSAWSFTTAGGGETGNNSNNNNGSSTFFDASSPTGSARDVVAPLKIYQSQHRQQGSRNFSRTSRALGMGTSTYGKQQQQQPPRPTSSVYEPFGRADLGLDRISRMEDDWNRNQMQRAAVAGSTAKASNATYATNYAYYTSNGTRQKETAGTAATNQYAAAATAGNKGSADSLAREYHDFVSQLAPVSQYGATPGAAVAVAGAAAASSPFSARNRAQREPTVPPRSRLPGLPRGGDESDLNTGFTIRPFMQGLI